MGIFDKLFKGSSTEERITSTPELMAEDKFWNIIQTTLNNSSNDFEKQQDQLRKELRKLPVREILLFDNRFRQLNGEAYDWALWGAAYIINGGCSDDTFMDFRGWIIAQGKDFYYSTLSDPERLAGIHNDRIQVEWEGFAYIPVEIFEEMSKQKMPQGYKANTQIKGEEWSEDNDDLKIRFPKLWYKYSGNS